MCNFRSLSSNFWQCNKQMKPERLSVECKPPPRPNSPLMKPYLNPLDPDFNFVLSQIAHTHKYQFPKYVWFFSSRSMHYCLWNLWKFLSHYVKKCCLLVQIHTEISWDLSWLTSHPSIRKSVQEFLRNPDGVKIIMNQWKEVWSCTCELVCRSVQDGIRPALHRVGAALPGPLPEPAGGPAQREEDASVLPRLPAQRSPTGVLGHWPTQNQDGHFPAQVEITRFY